MRVKVYEPYLLSKDILREQRCPWLIKYPGPVSLGDIEYFNTFPHV
jgi:hypothetical protein